MAQEYSISLEQDLTSRQKQKKKGSPLLNPTEAPSESSLDQKTGGCLSDA